MSNFIELIETVSKKPGMYLSELTISSFISYINGYDAAHDGDTLNGFKEWLVVKAGSGNNLAWWGIANNFIEGETEEERIISLSCLLQAYYKVKKDKGIKTILLSYQSWLQQQSWYDPKNGN